MKLVIYSTNEVGANFLLMHCLTQGDLDAVVCSRFDQMIELLTSEDPIDVLIVEQEPGCEKLFRYLLATESTLPLLTATRSQEILPEYPELNIIATLQLNESRQSLISKLTPVFDKLQSEFNSSSHLNSQPYCRVPGLLLTHLPTLRADLFVRLSKTKFVKLVRSGTQLSADELGRILTLKKLNHLYVRTDDSAIFLDHVKTYISKQIASVIPGSEQALQTVAMVQDLCQQLYNQVGFTKEMQEVAQVNVKLTMAAIGENPELSELLASSLFHEKNYHSSHSILVSYFACSIASKMTWLSKHTFQKLVLASLLHDISLPDPMLSALGTLAEIDAARAHLSGADLEAVLNHPTISAEVVQKFNLAPGEVDLIVSQHHERVDGSGFPLGINGTKISPLASVFIVAHDLVDEISKLGTRFTMLDFVAERRMFYTTGVFKKAMQVLSEETPSQTLAA